MSRQMGVTESNSHKHCSESTQKPFYRDTGFLKLSTVECPDTGLLESQVREVSTSIALRSPNHNPGRLVISFPAQPEEQRLRESGAHGARIHHAGETSTPPIPRGAQLSRRTSGNLQTAWHPQGTDGCVPFR